MLVVVGLVMIGLGGVVCLWFCLGGCHLLFLLFARNVVGGGVCYAVCCLELMFVLNLVLVELVLAVNSVVAFDSLDFC